MAETQSKWRRVFTSIFTSNICPFITLFIASFPLAAVLIASARAEKHIHGNGSLLTRLSPTAEIIWLSFSIFCGLLTTVVYIYCVDHITSTPETRGRRKWSLPWKKRRRVIQPPPNGTAQQVQWSSINSQALAVPVPSLNQSKERISAFREHMDSLPVHQPAGEEDSPHQTTGVNPAVVGYGADAGAEAVVAPTPGTSRPDTQKPGFWKYFCIYSMFIFCVIPLVLSVFTQILVRDSVYLNACDAYDWEVVLNARNGLNVSSPTNTFNYPTAVFRNLNKTGPQSVVQSFTMVMSPGTPAPKTHHSRRSPQSSKESKQGFLKPIKGRVPEYDHFFHLLPSSLLTTAKTHQRIKDALLSLISYDSSSHIYHGSYGSIRPREVSGNYRIGNYNFPMLAIHQACSEAQGYFGFPRVVLRRNNNVVLQTTRRKRGSCAEMKVCVRETTMGEAAIIVGPLLMKHVEAAGKCAKKRS